MANGKMKEWVTKEGIDLIRGWAMNGLTDEEISNNMGINVSTLYRWKKSNKEICEALKKGKGVADCEVVNALFRNAIAGDTTAQIFWLKNRMPELWRDKRDNNIDLNTGIDKSIEKMDSIISQLSGDDNG